MNLRCCKSISKILLFSISIIFGGFNQAQDRLYPVQLNPFFQHLVNSKSEIIEIGNAIEKQDFISPDAFPMDIYTQSLLKNKEGLFLFVNATGRVYKAVNLTEDSLYFKRLDKTHFYGYNGGSSYFSYKDTIYNFGGWGFWNTNGHLRYYSEFNKEWNIKALNKEIAVSPVLHHLDQKNGILYYTGNDRNHAEIKSKSSYPVVRMDIKNRENQVLGTLNPSLISELSKLNVGPIVIHAPNLNGLIVIIGYDIQYLMDFEHNRLLRMINPALRDFFYGNSRGQSAENCFIEDSTLYFTLARDSSNILFQTKISRNDFEKEGIPLYVKQIDGLAITGLVLLLLGLGTGMVWMLKKYRHGGRLKVKTNEATYSADEAETNLSLTENEMELIHFIYNASKNGRYASVDEINNILGIAKKSLEVQKKFRTEAVNRINHKFKVLTEEDTMLVERIRSEEDRRYQKYMIREENMVRLTSVRIQ